MSEKDKLKLFERLDALEEQVSALTWELARLRYKETMHGSAPRDENRPKFLDDPEVNFTAKFHGEPWPHVQFEEKDIEDED